MAAIVCHGLQSHPESQLVETRALKLRLPSSKDLAFKSCFWDSNIKVHHNEENSYKTETFQSLNPYMGNGGSFFDVLSDVSSKDIKEQSSTYVLPQQKSSSLLLSPKSLELCTENLGNESGTDIDENDIHMLSSLSSSSSTTTTTTTITTNCVAGGNLGTREQRHTRQHLAAKKAKTTKNFPPPLTTIRGSESRRVRSHREDGRLVIEVTRVPPSASCFQAERSHGRLRLYFLTNHTPSFDPEEETEEEVKDENEPTTNEEEFFESEMNGQLEDANEEEEEEEEEEEAEEEAEDEEPVVIARGGDKRMEKYERLRRCKEGGEPENKELLLNWGEPLWVATS